MYTQIGPDRKGRGRFFVLYNERVKNKIIKGEHKMKKLLALVMVVAMVMSMAALGIAVVALGLAVASRKKNDSSDNK